MKHLLIAATLLVTTALHAEEYILVEQWVEAEEKCYDRGGVHAITIQDNLIVQVDCDDGRSFPLTFAE